MDGMLNGSDDGLIDPLPTSFPLSSLQVLKRMPDVMSLNDFAGALYGRPVQGFVGLLSLVNMSVALVSEYTAIGDLFAFYVGGPRVLIILFVSITTALYVYAGGLQVSLWTDQAQAILSVVLILAASIYLAVEFREPLREPLPESLGVNYSGKDGRGWRTSGTPRSMTSDNQPTGSTNKQASAPSSRCPSRCSPPRSSATSSGRACGPPRTRPA